MERTMKSDRYKKLYKVLDSRLNSEYIAMNDETFKVELEKELNNLEIPFDTLNITITPNPCCQDNKYYYRNFLTLVFTDGYDPDSSDPFLQNIILQSSMEAYDFKIQYHSNDGILPQAIPDLYNAILMSEN